MPDRAAGLTSTVLFVYGSLLPGEPNHAQLVGARRLGGARTMAGYALLDLGAYPALVETGEGTTAVVGELWEVDAQHVAALDRFEGHPTLFERRSVRLEQDVDGAVRAEAYLYARAPTPSLAVVADGDWRAHRRAVRDG